MPIPKRGGPIFMKDRQQPQQKQARARSYQTVPMARCLTLLRLVAIVPYATGFSSPLVLHNNKKRLDQTRFHDAATARSTPLSLALRDAEVVKGEGAIKEFGKDRSDPRSVFVKNENNLAAPKKRASVPDASSSSDQSGKYIMLGLLWCATMLSALDRTAMSVAIVPMSTEFGLTDTAKGAISSLFSFGYGLCILPAGLVVASLSPRLIMGFGIALWSLATIATPSSAALVASTMVPLLVVRAFVGAGESFVLPTVQRLLTVWTLVEEKSFALATVFSGFYVGNIVAYLLSPVLMDTFGDWRYIFYIYGGGGLLLLVPWLAFAKDGPEQPVSVVQGNVNNVIEQERPSLAEQWDRSLAILREAPWSGFVQSKSLWGVTLAHCSKNWSLYNFLAWTPTFYSEAYGVNVRDSAWLAVAPAVTGMVFVFIAGGLVDYCIRNMQDTSDQAITNVRKIFQGVGLYGPMLGFAALASNLPEEASSAQVLLMSTVGLQAFNTGGFEVAPQEKAGPKWSGLIYSVTSLPAVLFGTLGVYCTGRILDSTGQDWSIVFGINAAINLLGATAYLLLYENRREFD